MVPHDPVPDVSDPLRGDRTDDHAHEAPSSAVRAFELSREDRAVLAFVGVVILAVAVGWGMSSVLVILAAAAGAFVALLIAPYIGGNVMLDRIHSDIIGCLGMGAYLVAGLWALRAAMHFLVAIVLGAHLPALFSFVFHLFFLASVGSLAKVFWPDTDTADMIIVVLGAIFGALLPSFLL